MRYAAAFLTGHSVLGCTGLSRLQREFQQRSGLPTGCWLPHNFPYTASFPYPEDTPLLAASWSNVRHYLRSRRPAFAREFAPLVSAAFAPFERIVVAAGSCGLELLNNLALPADLRARLHVFAYGPVSRRRPEVASHLLVQGRGDLLSRWFHPRVHHRIAAAHMGYLQAAETLALFRAYVGKVSGGGPLGDGHPPAS